MELVKRQFGVWIMALLLNIGVVIALVFIFFHDSGAIEALPVYLMTLAASFFITVVPVFIFKSKNPKKDLFGYGIPILLLLSLIYFVWDYYTCTGKFCSLGDIIYGFVFGASAIIFGGFYIIAKYSERWSLVLIESLIGVEFISIALVLVWIFRYVT